MLEIPRPEWMDTIPAAEMSEDEKAQVKEFEERVKKPNPNPNPNPNPGPNPDPDPNPNPNPDPDANPNQA